MRCFFLTVSLFGVSILRGATAAVTGLHGGSSVEGAGRVLAQGGGEDKLDVGGEGDVPVVFVTRETEGVDHVHHPDDGLKRLGRNFSYSGQGGGGG